MSAPPQAQPTTQRAVGSGGAKTLDTHSDSTRTEQVRAPAGHHRRRLVQSILQAVIATLILAVMLGAVFWSRSTTTHNASVERKQQRGPDVNIGHVVVGQGSSDCRTLSFDNSTGGFRDGSPEPCLTGQSPPAHGYQRGRFEAVRKQFSKPSE